MSKKDRYDAVIIGGGFFGCKIASFFKKHFNKILILEKENDLLLRASYFNQARVHNGYHYPRSLLTAWRSKMNYPRFMQEYSDCILRDFTSYYAVGKKFSKINARQFRIFCERISIPLETAENRIIKWFNPNLIEGVFKTKECIFNAEKLRHKIYEELERLSIDFQLNTEVFSVKSSTNIEEIEVICRSEINHFFSLKTQYVFNCTYSSINQILANSHLSIIPLKHELAEMALIDVPNCLKNVAITVMCGPFFSIMPFPCRQLHTLSHVRYTPVYYWQDREEKPLIKPNFEKIKQHNSQYPYMIRDTIRYLPIMKESTYIDSLWEIKTVLPQSEANDSRPILIKHHPNLQNLICVLGGKIDNIYDVITELTALRDKEIKFS